MPAKPPSRVRRLPGAQPSPQAESGLIYWPAVAVAAGLALALVVSLLLWVGTHPANVSGSSLPPTTSNSPPVLQEAEKPRDEQPAQAAPPPAEAKGHKKNTGVHGALTKPRGPSSRPAAKTPEEPKP
jgi:hypothetical protein